MTRARNSANLASQGNLFVDIANDRTGIGSVVPDQNLHVAGTAGFHADTTFVGDLYNATWDRSDNSLKFVDNAKIKLGTGGDLQIYHDGSFSRFQNGSTGDVLIKNAASGRYLYLQSDIIMMQPPGGGDVIFDGRADGHVKLYYDGSQKFETTAYGTNTTGTAVNDGLVVAGVATVTTMNVTGVLTYDDVTSVDSVGIITARDHIIINADNKQLKIGASSDFILYHDGTSTIMTNNMAGTSGNLVIQPKSGEDGIKVIPDAEVELYYNNSMKFETTNAGVYVNGTIESTNHIQITHTSPSLYLTDSNNNPDYVLRNNGGQFIIRDDTAGTTRLAVNTDGSATFSGNLTVSGNLSVTGTTSQNNSVSTAQKTITLASGAANNAAVDGAGVVIDAGSDTDKTLKWLDSTDRWTFTGGDVSANAFYGDGANLTNTGSSLSEPSTGTQRIVTTSLTSGTMTSSGTGSELAFDYANNHLEFSDNTRATFGTDNDLLIYHNGSHGVIENTTGNLHIKDDSIKIQSSSAASMLIATGGGSVELYHNATKRLETTSSGATVTGEARVTSHLVMNTADNQTVYIGAGNDITLHHDGSNSHIANTTGEFRIRSNDLRLMNAAGNEHYFVGFANGYAAMYYDNTQRIKTTSVGVEVTGFINATTGIHIPDGGDNDNSITIGNSNDLRLYHDGSNSYIKDRGTGNLYITGDNTLFIQSASGEDKLKATTNGSIELYHDNIKSLETIAEGIEIKKTASNANAFINLETSGGGQARINLITSSGNNRASRIDFYNQDVQQWTIINDYNQNGTNDFRINHGAESAIRALPDGAVELYHNGSGKFTTTSTGATITGTGALLVPVGTTAQRPSGAVGMIRFNSTTGVLENYLSTGWQAVNVIVPTIDSISGEIYSGLPSNITLNMTDATATISVVFKEGGTTHSTLTNVSVSSGAATVSVPSAVYGQSVGDTILINVINNDSVASTATSKTVQSTPSGGSVSTSGDYRIHQFTSSGTLTAPSGWSSSYDYVVVAGGGSGGNNKDGGYENGGGGGAGGMLTGSSTLSAGSYSISIGSGGAIPGGDGQTKGGNTTAFGLTAIGGGGGRTRDTSLANCNGGSGGGTTNWDDVNSPGSGTSGQGNRGGYATQVGNPDGGSGGGGGKNAVGGTGSGTSGGNGGSGQSSSITGSSITFAGGGGGGAGSGGSGGAGGGGNGANTNSINGGNGSGSRGGGGGGNMAPNGNAGNGGSGIVIVRYKKT